jgi:transcriptional regulator with XRE-family HTH domain
VALDAQTLQTLGHRIAVRRAMKTWTQAELAKHAGVTQVTIARLEKGRSPQVSVAILWAIAKALGVTMDYLVGRGKITEEEEEEQLVAV